MRFLNGFVGANNRRIAAPHREQLRLQVDGAGDPFTVLVGRSPELDPFAFPVSTSDEALLRARQRACGVDMDRIHRPEYHKELLDAIAATRASLSG
jgi:hypothetical protein